ncbi:MAG: ribonuclease Y [Deltaproteobacteria bacterium]|nr:ribonuclease Y [Candidatus Zymogenaceae bacterium]
MLTVQVAVSIVIGIVAGLALGYFLKMIWAKKKVEAAKETAAKILNEAHRQADSIKKEADLSAKDTLYQMKSEFERETKEKKNSLFVQEKRLLQKEENIEKKMEQIDQKESEISKKDRAIAAQVRVVEEKENKYNEMIEEQKKVLERISEISRDAAKEELVKLIEDDARHEAAKSLRRIEEELRENADKKSKEIISTAIQRYAGEYVTERTVSIVSLPNEEMKGRIIGREGRNIRAIEAATGVDLVIDDTPEAVILSSHNPIRREIARISLERLMSDGRIHPARIEEIVNKVGEELENAIRDAGERACFDLGLHGIHPELVKLIGRLKYRTSFAQNVYQHSLEVAFLMGIMAAELKLNIKQAKRAGLLHDIGKAVDHEVEGPHATIGADLARRYGESPRIIHTIAAHHNDEPPDSVFAVLIQAADTLSAARPGARKEMLETYVKRLDELERITRSFTGISKTYAIQAGRELRIIVSSDQLTDEESLLLSKDIAKKIEHEMTYPGQIKVTVIRETRSIEFAK